MEEDLLGAVDARAPGTEAWPGLTGVQKIIRLLHDFKESKLIGLLFRCTCILITLFN